MLKPRTYDNLQHRLIANSVMYESNVVPGHPYCWIWMGATRGNRRKTPYPSVTVYDPIKKMRRPKFAHRESLRVFKGIVLARDEPHLHLCNITLCICPDHLQKGTQSENMKQCVREGRHNSQKRGRLKSRHQSGVTRAADRRGKIDSSE